jgi:hypothetical protein
MAPQMSTISVCRYRWLRVPATKLVKNPSNLNRLPGFVFCAGVDTNNINGLAFRFKSPCSQTHILIREKISHAVVSFRGLAASIFHHVRSANSSSGTVLSFAMFESKTGCEFT